MNGRPIVGKLFYQMQVEGKRDWSYLSSKYEPLRVHGVSQARESTIEGGWRGMTQVASEKKNACRHNGAQKERTQFSCFMIAPLPIQTISVVTNNNTTSAEAKVAQ